MINHGASWNYLDIHSIFLAWRKRQVFYCIQFNMWKDMVFVISPSGNSWFCQHISKKVRSAYRIKGNLGEPLGQPPYGYLKSPEDKRNG